MPELQIASVDVAILLVYVLGTRLAIGWHFGLRIRGRGAEGYFLAGWDLRWPLIGLSFYVAIMSGSTFVALPASGYHSGIAAYHYEWLPALILVAFAWVLLLVYLRARVYTAPEYLERRFGRRTRLAFSGFLLVATSSSTPRGPSTREPPSPRSCSRGSRSGSSWPSPRWWPGATSWSAAWARWW